ncbi:Protein of unknown function [Halogranum rubrum]|uniref:DUF429 domain-containing protein n=1 Tax=Halogranum rubrum TaxID=553466 RepID=A0A1I4EBQ6_9EURY|nr:DUF429 domain-containing protein [Halogranum rubrum]SFL02037.1 Protein of unknown function [Halogranum rubrum]
MRAFEPPTRVYGVDFSGAADAGHSIWVSEGVVDDVEVDEDEGLTGRGLRIVDCRPATEWFDESADREEILPALAAFLGELGGGVAVGLDFPFGLPNQLVNVDTWETFLYRFPGCFSSPDDLRQRCTERAELLGDGQKSQLFRATDKPLSALSPYDLRLQSQTFYGIRDVLRPLVISDSVRVHPMQRPSPEKPSLLEVYPAGVLDELGLHHTKYKDGSEEGRTRREEILTGLADAGITIDGDVRQRAITDDDGDALDAIVAAVGTYRNTRDPSTLYTTDECRAIEGYIYV